MIAYSVSNDAEKAKTLCDSSNFLVDTKMMSQQKVKVPTTLSNSVILPVALCDLINHKTKFVLLEFQHGITSLKHVLFQDILIHNFKKS